MKELIPDDTHLHHWLDMARERIAFQGLPARICWVGLGERHRLGLAFNEMVRNGELKAPIVIGRDHLDSGSVASPNRETEAMKDGSDAVSDWPLLNALLNTAVGATWVSLHHGGGVGMGYSQHSGMVIVCDGTPRRRGASRACSGTTRHRRHAPRRCRLRDRHRLRAGAGAATCRAFSGTDTQRPSRMTARRRDDRTSLPTEAGLGPRVPARQSRVSCGHLGRAVRRSAVRGGEGGCGLDRRAAIRARPPRRTRESRPPPGGAAAAGFVDGQIRQAAPVPREIRPGDPAQPLRARVMLSGR